MTFTLPDKRNAPRIQKKRFESCRRVALHVRVGKSFVCRVQKINCDCFEAGKEKLRRRVSIILHEDECLVSLLVKASSEKATRNVSIRLLNNPSKSDRKGDRSKNRILYQPLRRFENEDSNSHQNSTNTET